jgi:colanic acid biosynthesis glycosyl transferase WcaI
MGVKQGLNSLIEAALALRSQSDVEVVIVGDGGEKSALMQRVTDMGLTNIQFRPLQSMENLGELLATADVAIVPQKEGVKDIVLPSKLCNLLASGRPVIAAASPETELGKIVSESGCGVLVAPENGGQIADRIGQLRGAHALRNRMGRDGRRYMEARLSGPMILRDFMGRMEVLVSGRATLRAPVTSTMVRSISPGATADRGIHPVVMLQAENEAGANGLVAERRRRGDRKQVRRYG